jgi:hypothetical protein
MTNFVLKRNNVAKKVLIYIVGKLDHRGCFVSIEMKKVNLILIMVLSLAFLVASIALAAGPKAIRKYPIPDHGVLELNMPTSWRIDVHKPQENLPPTIIFSPKKGDDFKVLITVLWDNTGEQDFNSPDKIRTYVQEDGQKILPKAVETKLLVQQMRGVNNTGYFFSLTDKAPNPGEFRYITRGGMAVGNLLLNVTILYRVKDSEFVKDALSVLREAKQSAK